MPAGGYRLEISTKSLELRGADEAGLVAGLQTLWQWFHLHRDRGVLPNLVIDDVPDFANRGVMLDISRGKVMRLETLKMLVDRFASWKINQLQLYVEHTFAYAGHRRVWAEHSPMTPAEFRELAVYCEARGISLVPNQNSFGHFHRWLVHEPYRDMAECPAGIEHPFSLESEPFSLCPGDEKALALLEDLYDQQIPLTKGRFFNGGLDETFDLGMGRSAEVCEARGKHQVYLDFLRQVAGLAQKHQRRLMFWGDILIQHPEYLDDVPLDAVPLLWGYEADHPFATETAAAQASGRDYYVCPGTSSWNSFGGRYHNAMANLRAAAKHGYRHGASGYLITDWGDFGHLQPLVVSYPAFTYGAALAWDSRLGEKFEADACAVALGLSEGEGRLPFQLLSDVHRKSGTAIMNGSALFFAVIRAHDTLGHPKLQPLEHADLEQGQVVLDQVLPSWYGLNPQVGDADLCRQEMEWAARLLGFALSFSGWRREPTSVLKPALRKQLADLMARFEWLRNTRNKPTQALESKGFLWRCLRLLEYL
jgi:hypothetical protein